MTVQVKQIPTEVVEKDKELVNIREQNQEALAHHRWHWTLDETNPERVSFRQYAIGTGVNESKIRKYAKGYASWLVAGGNLPAAIAVADIAEATAAEAEGVAEATGKAVSTVLSVKTTDKIKAAVTAAKFAVAKAKSEDKDITPAKIKQVAKDAATKIVNQPAKTPLPAADKMGQPIALTQLQVAAGELRKARKELVKLGPVPEGFRKIYESELSKIMHDYDLIKALVTPIDDAELDKLVNP